MVLAYLRKADDSVVLFVLPKQEDTSDCKVTGNGMLRGRFPGSPRGFLLALQELVVDARGSSCTPRGGKERKETLACINRT